MSMLDFTSALYLGLRHPSWTLRPWERLSSGAPAALVEPLDADRTAAAIASLTGCGAATIARSTLHLFWDLFGVLAERNDVGIHIDAGAYPVARWGVERLGCRGLPVRTFRHHDAAALDRAASSDARNGLRPVVVTDGFCTACGGPAPLRDYLALVRRLAGTLVIDDTQALGVLGDRATSNSVFGAGGGGSLRWLGLDGPEIIVGASLAKGFGAPVAVLCAAPETVEGFEARAATRMHCSPPSAVDVRAAERALSINRTHGDDLRRRLARLVAHFRDRMAALGVPFGGGCFPVQTLADERLDAASLHNRLLERGVRAVLHAPAASARPRLSFLIGAAHRPTDLDRAAGALGEAARGARRGSGWTHEFDLEGENTHAVPRRPAPPPTPSFKVGPFPSAQSTSFDPAPSQSLQACLDASFPAPHPGTLDRRPSAALIDLTNPTKLGYAGRGDDDSYYVGSLAKIAPMFAAFELRVRVQRAVDEWRAAGRSVTAAGWHLPLIAALKRAWQATVGGAVPHMPPDFPDLQLIFNFSTGAPAGAEVSFKPSAHPVDFRGIGVHGSPGTAAFADLIELMVRWSNNLAAGRVIRALGYSYINGVLANAGFFAPASPSHGVLHGNGIWVSGSYDSHDWKPGEDPMALSARGAEHYKPTTNFAATARQVARLLALGARGQLFGGDPLGRRACSDMIGGMGTDRDGLVSFIEKALEPVNPTAVSSKIGVGDPSPRSGLVGLHDCAVVRRTGTSGTELHYVVVGLGGLTAARGRRPPPPYDVARREVLEGLWRMLDKCVDNAH